jgi:hypothetical protein
VGGWVKISTIPAENGGDQEASVAHQAIRILNHINVKDFTLEIVRWLL